MSGYNPNPAPVYVIKHKDTGLLWSDLFVGWEPELGWSTGNGQGDPEGYSIAWWTREAAENAARGYGIWNESEIVESR
jgi:hypothetical protein